jgi:hypothetical protein
MLSRGLTFRCAAVKAGAGSWPGELGLTAPQTQSLLLLCADVLRASKVRTATSAAPDPGVAAPLAMQLTAVIASHRGRESWT